jgi:hypothetical protein
MLECLIYTPTSIYSLLVLINASKAQQGLLLVIASTGLLFLFIHLTSAIS